MQNAPVYSKPLLGYRTTTVKKKAWKKALAAFEAGKHNEVFDHLLVYLNPQQKSIKNEHGHKEIVIPHGCVHIHLTLTPDRYEIKVPFLRTDHPSVGLMHQIAKLNMYELALAQVNYQNNEFFFYYESPLALCHPNKVYDTMKQMATKADIYAEQWARELDASLIETPFSYSIPSSKKDQAWPLFQQQLSQLEQYVSYFEQKHWESHVWVTFSVTLRYLDFALNPRGRLRREILGDVEEFTEDVSSREKARRAADLLAKYRAFIQEEFLSCIYTPHLLFRDRPEAELSAIHKDLNSCHDYLVKEKPGEIYATVYILLFWLRLPYYYDLPPFLKQCVIHHLLKASGKPWDKAYQKLWTAIQEVRKLRSIPKSLWASLFNR